MTIEWWEEAKKDLDFIYEYLAELNEKMENTKLSILSMEHE